MVQHFLLEMNCGHFYQVSAVLVYKDEPYSPQYIGKEMPAKCCAGDHKVKAQESVHEVTGHPTMLKK